MPDDNQADAEFVLEDGTPWTEFLEQQQIPEPQRQKRCLTCWRGASRCSCVKREAAE